MRRAAIGLGTSLGDRRRTLALVVRLLQATPGLELERMSSLYRTPPLRGGSARNLFLNAVALFRTDLAPREILDLCVAVERRLGRRRARYWGDRTIDLDLLLVDDLVCDEPDLVVPHPAIRRRPFVRVPLIEVWADARDPRTGLPYAHMEPPDRPRVARAGILPGTRPPRRSTVPRSPR